MKIKLTIILKAILIILIITLGVGMTAFFIKHEIHKKQVQDNIEYIYHIYNNDNSQDILNKHITENNEHVGVPVKATEGKTETSLNSVAVLEIPKIEFKDIVLEGTTQDTLANGIGLFEHSSILEGNVCLAGHNTTRFLKKLNELEIGDSINYLSCLGRKEYVVSHIQIIDENDWSLLEETTDNRITIITCVKNNPNLRFCVQGMEKI